MRQTLFYLSDHCKSKNYNQWTFSNIFTKNNLKVSFIFSFSIHNLLIFFDILITFSNSAFQPEKWIAGHLLTLWTFRPLSLDRKKAISAYAFVSASAFAFLVFFCSDVLYQEINLQMKLFCFAFHS